MDRTDTLTHNEIIWLMPIADPGQKICCISKKEFTQGKYGFLRAGLPVMPLYANLTGFRIHYSLELPEALRDYRMFKEWIETELRVRNNNDREMLYKHFNIKGRSHTDHMKLYQDECQTQR